MTLFREKSHVTSILKTLSLSVINRARKKTHTHTHAHTILRHTERERERVEEVTNTKKR